VYWNLADPGWAYGLYYGVIGPLLMGQPILWRGVPFAAADVYAAILRHAVTNLAGAPTVYRNLRSAGVPAGFRHGHRLRAISSAGEPLDAELLEWSEHDLGVAIRDHDGQSELGMAVFFAQHPELRREPVPGSTGTAAPGIRAVTLDEHGNEADHGVTGELAIDTSASPAYWFRGYFRDAERTAERFDTGRGTTSPPTTRASRSRGCSSSTVAPTTSSRARDTRIGPFEVESALIAHPSVAEVAVIGTPDPLRSRRSRRTSCWAIRRRRATRWSTSFRLSSRRGSPSTSSRGASCSSTSYRGLRRGRSCAQSCARTGLLTRQALKTPKRRALHLRRRAYTTVKSVDIASRP
jgi:acetyl-CoA synthetase